MKKKWNRREFATATMAAGAAAMALPKSLLATGATTSAAASGVTSAAAAGAAAASAAIVTPRKSQRMPIEVEYGGRFSWGRDLTLADTLTPAGEAVPNYPNGWKEGTTIPAEYYYDPEIYAHDEKYLRENFWFMVDHQSRIPKPGDYFVFEFGQGTSVIVLRDQNNEVKATTTSACTAARGSFSTGWTASDPLRRAPTPSRSTRSPFRWCSSDRAATHRSSAASITRGRTTCPAS